MLPLLFLRDAGLAANASNLNLTDTVNLPLPINCVLIGNQPLGSSEVVVDFKRPNIRIIRRMTP